MAFHVAFESKALGLGFRVQVLGSGIERFRVEGHLEGQRDFIILITPISHIVIPVIPIINPLTKFP